MSGGGNDYKLSYKAAHNSVVKAFLCLFIEVMNVGFFALLILWVAVLFLSCVVVEILIISF